MDILERGILMGLIATVGMDVWAVVAKHVFRLPTADWAHVGRWFGHMRRGTFFHRPIAESAPIQYERAIGWISHYTIGAVYGILYVGVVQIILVAEPSFSSALVFGVATLIAPWLILQPALGAGIFATKTPSPNVVRATNFTMHVVFGASLYLGSIIIR